MQIKCLGGFSMNRRIKKKLQIRRYNILNDDELRVVIGIAIDNIYKVSTTCF